MKEEQILNCLKKETLLDEKTIGERLAKIYISDMKNIQGKAGMFGGKFSFNYDGKEYKFKLPAKAEKFVDFFVM